MSSEKTSAGAAGREEKKANDGRRVAISGAQPNTGLGNTGARASAKSAPEWANGLRQLYDSVIEEPIPDSFKDLLEQLNDDGR